MFILFSFILRGQESSECEAADSISIDLIPEQTGAERIGAHHCLSYARPKWYWLPFNWMVRCQQISIQEQIKYGVVYFDFRIRFKKGKVISGHGIIDYNVNVLHEFERLNSHSSDENPFYIRLMYESGPFHKNPSVEEMKTFVEKVKNDYPRLIFTQSHIKAPYTYIDSTTDVPTHDCYQHYRDYGARSLWAKLKSYKLPYPKRYAKRNNKNCRSQTDENKICIYDFVEIR
jgi:hypothetical protein